MEQVRTRTAKPSRTSLSQLLRFLFVGGMCYVLSLALIFFLVAFAEVHYLVANGISFVFIVLLGHLMNRHATFKSGNRYGPELARYAILSVLHAFTALTAVACLVELAGMHYLLAATVVAAFFALASYFFQRRIVFRPTLNQSHDSSKRA